MFWLNEICLTKFNWHKDKKTGIMFILTHNLVQNMVSNCERKEHISQVVHFHVCNQKSPPDGLMKNQVFCSCAPPKHW